MLSRLTRQVLSCSVHTLPRLTDCQIGQALSASAFHQYVNMASATTASSQTGAKDIDLSLAGFPVTTLNRSIVFVLGGPGSGKGTQCARLVEEFGIVHLSAGDLLRAHMKSGSQEGNMVAQMIKDGQIVPSHVTISLLQKAMADSAQDKFLIDGFPRNDENRNAFEQQTGSEPDFVLFLDCPEEVMEKRLLGRQEGRTDDNIESIKKRFRVFVESSMPVIKHYEGKGKLRRFDATPPPSEVFQQVKKLFVRAPASVL
ncbi:UMP-CMP kinase 3 [Trebouxia sp. C0009 RCD-2024]